MAFTNEQPTDGDTIMHCGHVVGRMHWFQYERPIRFQRLDGTRGEASWFAACERCFIRHGEKVVNFVRGDGDLDRQCAGDREDGIMSRDQDQGLRILDPTTVAIAAQSDERDQLRAENQRLSKALVAAYTDVEGVTADRDRLSKLGDAMFVEGYDQAVREVRDHFVKQRQVEVVAEIEKVFAKDGAS